MKYSVIIIALLTAWSSASGQLNRDRNIQLADSLRSELFAGVDRSMAGLEWNTLASRHKGRRIVMKGRKGNTTIKRVIIARTGGTHERLVVKHWPTGSTGVKATLVNDRLVFAQWTTLNKEGGFSIPIERTYVEGRLFLVRSFDENGAAQAMHTESLVP